METAAQACLMGELEKLGTTLDAVLDALPASVALLDPSGTIVWQNRASIDRVGDRRGTGFLAAIAPEYRHAAETDFVRLRFNKGRTSRREIVVVSDDGRRMRSIAISAPVVRGVKVVGVISVSVPLNWDDGPVRAPHLAPRQLETLQLLSAGLSTSDIATELGVTLETARNYIRRLLKALGVHSRVEAVARARAARLVRDPAGSSEPSQPTSSAILLDNDEPQPHGEAPTGS
jgi:DNA-binding CsgD family transcriptional regulator